MWLFHGAPLSWLLYIHYKKGKNGSQEWMHRNCKLHERDGCYIEKSRLGKLMDNCRFLCASWRKCAYGNFCKKGIASVANIPEIKAQSELIDQILKCEHVVILLADTCSSSARDFQREMILLGKIIQRLKLVSEMYFATVCLLSCFLCISNNQDIKTTIILNALQLKSKLVFQLD